MFRRFGKSEKEEAASAYFTSSATEESLAPHAPINKILPKKSELPLDLTLPSSLLDEKKNIGSFQREEPETTLGEGVTFRGELCFERCLRIDGIFEGS